MNSLLIGMRDRRVTCARAWVRVARLVRVCTEKYVPLERNMGDTRMHLTNYSINKGSEGFVQPEGIGEGEDEGAHKRLVSAAHTAHALPRHAVHSSH